MVTSVITHVHKDSSNVITHVKAQTPNGKMTLTKAEVINLINTIMMFFVVPSGEEVHIVDFHYIRSDANNIKEDNLGELPDFNP